MTRARFRPVDIWSDDDPAVALLRSTLDRPPASASEPVAPPAPVLDPLSELQLARHAVRSGIPGAVDRLRAAIARVRAA